MQVNVNSVAKVPVVHKFVDFPVGQVFETGYGNLYVRALDGVSVKLGRRDGQTFIQRTRPDSYFTNNYPSTLKPVEASVTIHE